MSDEEEAQKFIDHFTRVLETLELELLLNGNELTPAYVANLIIGGAALNIADVLEATLTKSVSQRALIAQSMYIVAEALNIQSSGPVNE